MTRIVSLFGLTSSTPLTYPTMAGRLKIYLPCRTMLVFERVD